MRTLIGYVVRRGKVRGEGEYMGPGTNADWQIDRCRSYTNGDRARVERLQRNYIREPSRIVAVYRVFRKDIEDMTAVKIDAWLQRNWGLSVRQARYGIRRGDWRKP